MTSRDERTAKRRERRRIHQLRIRLRAARHWLSDIELAAQAAGAWELAADVRQLLTAVDGELARIAVDHERARRGS